MRPISLRDVGRFSFRPGGEKSGKSEYIWVLKWMNNPFFSLELLNKPGR